MRVMGIDPSTKCGIAIVDSGKVIVHTEEIEFKKLKGFARITALVERVYAIHEQYKPDSVAIESMFIGHPSSAIPIVQIGSFIRYFFWQEDIKYQEVGPTVLKKFVAGKGNAKKEQIMMYVSKHWGFEAPTNNIADAVGIAMVGLCLSGEPFLAYQSAAVASLSEDLVEN